MGPLPGPSTAALIAGPAAGNGPARPTAPASASVRPEVSTGCDADLKAFTVLALKERCRNQGLKVGGCKAELVARLIQARPAAGNGPARPTEIATASSGHLVALGLASREADVFYDGLLVPIETALRKSGAAYVRSRSVFLLLFLLLIEWRARHTLLKPFSVWPHSGPNVFAVCFCIFDSHGRSKDTFCNETLAIDWYLNIFLALFLNVLPLLSRL